MRRVATLAVMLLLPARLAAGVEYVSVSAGGAAAKVIGVDARDSIGTSYTESMAIGDVSGDGIPDLAIASIPASGPGNARDSCGEAWVVFGPASSWGERDLAAMPAEVNVIGSEMYGLLGSVLIADVNDDGNQDLVMGQSATRYPDLNDSVRGQVCIAFGPLAPAVIDLATQDPGLCITGPAQGDRFGTTLAAGDVNGDGVTDLVVGAPGSDVATANGGAIVVLYGPLTPGPVRHLGGTPADVRILGRSSDGYLGADVAVADVSGDGIGDIIGTQPGARHPIGGAATGEVDVLFGGLPSGTQIDLRSVAPDVVVRGVDLSHRLIGFVSTGDVDGDGQDDLVVPSIGDGPTGANAGSNEFHVLFGALARGTIIDDVQVQSDVTIVGHPGTQFIGILDVASRAGGPGQILLAASRIDGQCGGGGTAYLLSGVTGPGLIDLTTDPPQLDLVIGGGNLSFGDRVLLADMDLDGVADPVISGPDDSGPLRDRPSAGAIYVVRRTESCEQPPPGLGPASLHVRRAADDVVLDHDISGTGDEGIGIDIYRGTIDALRGWWADYDHALLPAHCGLLAPSSLDTGAAAPGLTGYYYLATHGCPAACWRRREIGSLGDSSTGPRPLPAYPDRDCR